MTNEEILKNLDVIESELEHHFGGYPFTEEDEILFNTIDKCRTIIKNQISENAKTHFIDIDNYYCCRVTKKAIRYPLIGFKDLLYCPQCGKELKWSK